MPNAIGAQAASRKLTLAGTGITSSGRHVEAFAREPVNVKAEDAGNVLTQIVATFAAGRTGPAGEAAIHDDGLADLEAIDAAADSGDLARRLGPYDERQLALDERHAAIAPDVEVIERHGADADLHLASGRRGRRGEVEHFKLLFLDEAERAHNRLVFEGKSLASAYRCPGRRRQLAKAAKRAFCATSRVMMIETFWPPKPKEFDIAAVTLASRAWFGTTSKGIAGSGTS